HDTAIEVQREEKGGPNDDGAMRTTGRSLTKPNDMPTGDTQLPSTASTPYFAGELISTAPPRCLTHRLRKNTGTRKRSRASQCSSDHFQAGDVALAGHTDRVAGMDLEVDDRGQGSAELVARLHLIAWRRMAHGAERPSAARLLPGVHLRS